MVEVARPAGTLVDLLQGDDVGREPLQGVSHLQQVGPDFSRRGKPLDGRQPPAVGNVESNQAKPRHPLNLPARNDTDKEGRTGKSGHLPSTAGVEPAGMAAVS